MEPTAVPVTGTPSISSEFTLILTGGPSILQLSDGEIYSGAELTS